ncbi:MAG: hypothetical protein ABSB49_10185 [Polyangia bacterium]
MLVLTAPLICAGPIRCDTGLSLPTSFVLACLLCAGLAWLCYVRKGSRAWRLDPTRLLLTEAAALLLAGFATWALYNRDFDGFMNLDGWDGGTHVFIKDQFAQRFPAIYNGQVAYYGFAWLIERIMSVSSFRSFALAFYVTVVGSATLPWAVTSVAISCRTWPKLALGTAVATLASVGVMLVVILPLLHYNQAAGYYVHTFGLLPLLGLWLADARIRSPLLRLAALGVGVLMVRYTYSLNLADTSVAVAAVLLVDETRGWRKVGHALVAVGLTAAAFWVATQIAPIFRIWGGMQGYSTAELRKADMMLLGGCVLYLATQGYGSRWRPLLASPIVRAVRFPVFFAAANAAFFTHFAQGKGVQRYYPWKYQMWACTLLALALVVVLAHLAVGLGRRGALRSPRTWLGLLAVGAALTLVTPIWVTTFSGYRKTLFERMRPHGPPYQFLRPLADPGAMARIEAILAAEHKRFGGYLTAFFPMFSFMNGALGRHQGTQTFFAPAREPGTCVFWVSRERDIYRLGPAHDLDVLRAAVSAEGRTCTEYPVAWKTTPQSLCYHCY